MDESFLTTEEVLDYLQVNLRTVYRLIKAGKIPAVRVGRQWRFRKRDIDAWLESQRPRTAARGRRPAATRPATPVAGRPRVLVVDDEATIRDLLSKTLALAEYDVDLAPDGRTALERLRMIPYDLLITDLKMPGVDGLAVIREARRLKADIPVIIITGFSTKRAPSRRSTSACRATSPSRSAFLACSPPPPRRSANKPAQNCTVLPSLAVICQEFDHFLGACAENS